MRILGIDPGLQVCGYACIDAVQNERKLIEAGTFKTDVKLALPQRLNQISRDMESLLERFKPDIAAVEQLYSHYAHPKTAILMAHARGVILQNCAKASVEVKSFNATQIKKAITGNGRASKLQMQKTIQTLLALPERPEPNDVADAIAAALSCADLIRIAALA